MMFSPRDIFDNAAMANEHIDVRALVAAMGAEVAEVDCANVSDAGATRVRGLRHRRLGHAR